MILLVHFGPSDDDSEFFSLTTARRVFVAVVGTTACDVFEQGFNGPGPCYEFRVRFVFIV